MNSEVPMDIRRPGNRPDEQMVERQVYHIHHDGGQIHGFVALAGELWLVASVHKYDQHWSQGHWVLTERPFHGIDMEFDMFETVDSLFSPPSEIDVSDSGDDVPY